MRVSGTEGVAYSGNYGSIVGNLQTVDDTIGNEPRTYEVDVEEGAFDGVTAFFQKRQPGGGKLQVGILSDGFAVGESMTYADQSTAAVDWFPPNIPLEEGLTEEGP